MADNIVEYVYEINTEDAAESLDNLGDNAENAGQRFEALAETASESMESVGESADKAADSMKGMRTDSGRLAGTVNQLGRGLNMLNPALGESVIVAGSVLMAVRGLSVAMGLLNKKLILLTVSVTAITAAWKYFFSASEDASESADNARKQQEALEKQAERTASAIRALAAAQYELNRSWDAQQAAIEDVQFEISQLTGETDVLDAQERARAKRVEKFAEAELKLQEDKIVRLRGLLKLKEEEIETTKESLNTTLSSARALKKSSKENTEEYRKLRRAAKETAEEQRSLGFRIGSLKTEIRGLEKETRLWKDTGTNTENAIAERAEELNQVLIKRDAILNKIRKDQEKSRKKGGGANRLAKLNQKLERERLKAINELERIRNKLLSARQALSARNNQITEDTRAINQQTLRQEIERLTLLAKRQTGMDKSLTLSRAEHLQSQAQTEEIRLQNKELEAIRQADQEIIDKAKINLEEMKAQLEVLKSSGATKLQIAQATADIKTEERNITELIKTRNKNQEDAQTKQHAQRLRDISAESIAEEKATQKRLKSLTVISTQINSLTEQFVGFANITPFTEMEKGFESVRNKLLAIREADPFGPAVQDVDMMLKVLDAVEKKARLQIEAEIQIEKMTGPINALTEALGMLTNPVELTSKLTTAIGSAFGGPLGKAIGGSIGGVVGAIAALGEKTPEEIEQELIGFVKAFTKGLELLPDILVTVLPKFTVAMTTAIVAAIPKLIVALFNVLKDLWNLLFPDDENEKGLLPTQREKEEGTYLKRLASDFATYWSNVFGTDEGMRGGGRFSGPFPFPSARQGMRMTQGTGLALLHPNEFVVPQSGMAPQAVNRTLDGLSNGGQTNININSIVTERSAIDELVRKIQNRYQAFGQSTSTLFAS